MRHYEVYTCAPLIKQRASSAMALERAYTALTKSNGGGPYGLTQS